jgi:catechol 2,3-dioxygenase-like lactoylglutathione lyase family enzyme
MNLNQVTVPSTNVSASAEFYRRLGLRQIVETSSEYARFECPDGEATFSVHRVDRVADGSGIVVYFECAELDRVVEKLKGDGIVFDSDPQDQRWLWREAYLHDPDGNSVCLYHAGTNRRNPPWRIP